MLEDWMAWCVSCLNQTVIYKRLYVVKSSDLWLFVTRRSRAWQEFCVFHALFKNAILLHKLAIVCSFLVFLDCVTNDFQNGNLVKTFTNYLKPKTTYVWQLTNKQLFLFNLFFQNRYNLYKNSECYDYAIQKSM